jgi:subtilase family serine protease
VAIALAMVGAMGSAAHAASASSTPIAGTALAWASRAAYVGQAPSASRLATQVYLAGDRAGLAAAATAVSNPKSPDYQHFLTPAQVNKEFGATAAQVAAVEAWLRGSGLSVRRVSAQEIEATGTVAQAERAYGTRLGEYKIASGTFRAPAGNASAPASVAGDVLAIDGLSNKPAVMKPASLENPTGPVGQNITGAKLPMSKGADGATFLGPTPCSAYYGQLTDRTDPKINGSAQPYAICGYTPTQIRGAYNLNALETGSGVTVAVLDAYGSPTLLADANEYATNHGGKAFASGHFTENVTPGSWTNESQCGGESAWQPEQSLDVEAVHSMAPGANVYYYGANSCADSDLLAAFTSIVDNHSADVVTDSWGEVISSSTGDLPSSVIDEYTQLFEQAALEGIEISFSAGDCGAEVPSTSCGADDTSTQPQADFPDSDPWVTSVGGTAVEIGQNNKVENVVPWGDDAWLLENGSWASYGWIYGGGGGTSGPALGGDFTGFAQPSYQRGVVPTSLSETLPTGQKTTTPMRVTPDVSMDADPFTGFLIGYTQTLPDGSTGYAESDIGGTSLASPLFAGLVADGLQSHLLRKGFQNPALYTDYALLHTLQFRNVVSPTSAATAPYQILPAYGGTPPIAVRMGDDQLLIGQPGYSDAGGVGMPLGIYLGL